MNDVDYTVLALAAETMFRDPATGAECVGLEPPLPPTVASGWALRCWLTAVDALFRKSERLAVGARRVFYGFLAESRALPGTFALVVRGTEGAIEWAEDAEALQIDYQYPGGVARVESGFWGIYRTMQDSRGNPVWRSVARAVGNGRCVAVGHSLGAALATYLAVDLAPLLTQGRTSLRAIASPHPGDPRFAALAAQRVPDHMAYWHRPDLVPQVPPSIPFVAEYCSLPNRTVLPAGGIGDNPLCNHHALTYAWKMAGQKALDLAGPLAGPYLPCILSSSGA